MAKITEDIVQLIASLPDGTYIVEHEDGRLERKRSQTDWSKLDKLTDQDIDAAMADDPDWDAFKEIDWPQPLVARSKQPISIRIDGDVLDFFKKQGAGYQKRINAVLRSYMDAVRKGKQRP